MRFSCSLEMVNMLTSGPCAFTRQSKKFWTDYLKYIAAAGFSAIELPFNCFHSDAMAFETGRSGIPCNAQAIKNKYGSPEEFLCFLNQIGIDAVSSVHVNANDALLELAAAETGPESYYDLLYRLCMEGLEHADSLHAKNLVVSPTPEIGWIMKFYSDDVEVFSKKTMEVLNTVVRAAGGREITVALRNEFWNLYAGSKWQMLMDNIEKAVFAPDLAHLKISGECEKDTVRKYADRIACLHMTDTSFEDKTGNAGRINAELPVKGSQKVFSDCGEGDVDISGVLKILQENHYDGWIVCENRRTLDVYRGLLKLGWFVNQKLKKELQ